MKINWFNLSVFLMLLLWLILPVRIGMLEPIYKEIFEGSFLEGRQYLLAGFSTIIAGIVALVLHRDLPHLVKVFGRRARKYIILLLLPPVIFSIMGMKNNYGMNPHLYGFSMASVNVLYAFSEEFGWRRYLQNALLRINFHLRYLSIATLWWLWHWRFETSFDLFVFPIICLVGGYFMGVLSHKTRSIIPAVTVHALISLTTTGNAGSSELMTALLVLMGWVVLEWVWKLK